MTEALCRALRGIKTSEDGEAVWKGPGDELILPLGEAQDLREGGYVTILAMDTAPPAAMNTVTPPVVTPATPPALGGEDQGGGKGGKAGK